MKYLTPMALATTLATALAAPAATADIDASLALQAQSGALDSYERVLPLKGGSNFRDLGGYRTEDGKTVRRGLLYRSGVMTGLTDGDEDYLADFGFETVVDLRSEEERDLYPNHWARDAGIDYVKVDYSMMEMMKSASVGDHGYDPVAMYRQMPYYLKPQLKAYFDRAVAGRAPMVVNCSAGQDRTGITSALMLTALGVPRPQVVQDYVLSTEYRRPLVERGDVDLAEAAQSNGFARMMLRYADEESEKASPLITEEGIPYLYYALEQIEADYGSVMAFLDEELGVSEEDIATLRSQYLQ